jgi:hypothetical protein
VNESPKCTKKKNKKLQNFKKWEYMRGYNYNFPEEDEKSKSTKE